MWRVGREEEDEWLKQLARALLLGGNPVHENHHLGNGGIKSQGFRVLTNLLDGLMQDFEKCSIGLRIINDKLAFLVAEQAPDPTEKAIDALEAFRAPRFYHVERAHEHFIHSQRIRPVLANNMIGAVNVGAAFRFAHLLSVFPENHSLVDETHEWFGRRDVTEVEED